MINFGTIDNSPTKSGNNNFTGKNTFPTPATSDNSQQAATTAFVKAQGYLTSALNTSASNATATGKSNMANFGMPNYSSGVSKTMGTQYTADKNGWVKFGGGSTSGERNITLTIGSASNVCQVWKSSTNTSTKMLVPVPKGATYKAAYQTGSDGGVIEFFPCLGG